MGSSRRNDPNSLTSEGEGDKEDPAVDLADGLASFFAVIFAVVYPLNSMGIEKHGRDVSEIEASRFQRRPALLGIPLKFHRLIYTAMPYLSRGVFEGVFRLGGE